MQVIDEVRVWNAHARVDRWDADQVAWAQRRSGLVAPSGDQLAALIDPYETTEHPGNLLTTAGVTRLASLLNGAGGQAATNTATRLGVGNGVTAAAIGDTDLSASAGSANRWFMTMDATFPSVSGGVLTAKSTFASADANFVWAEWGIDIGAPTVTAGATVNATLLNRKIATMGTKASGAVWALTATITLS